MLISFVFKKKKKTNNRTCLSVFKKIFFGTKQANPFSKTFLLKKKKVKPLLFAFKEIILEKQTRKSVFKKITLGTKHGNQFSRFLEKKIKQKIKTTTKKKKKHTIQSSGRYVFETNMQSLEHIKTNNQEDQMLKIMFCS